MKYILNKKVLTDKEMLEFLKAVKTFQNSRIVKKNGLKYPIATYKIVLEGNIDDTHTWICDTDIHKVIQRAKEYFSFQKTEFIIYINDNYCIYRKRGNTYG
jgi:hypothetical protein